MIRKAADSEKVAAEDSENDVVESPEVKRAKMEYLKRLYSGNKQQSKVETEKKKEESHRKDKAKSHKKKSEGIWSNAKQSEVVVVEMEEKKEESHSDDEAEIQMKKFEDIWRHANMLKHVAHIPAIAEAITDTPDALLPMIKMDPETFRMPPLNSEARKSVRTQ